MHNQRNHNQVNSQTANQHQYAKLNNFLDNEANMNNGKGIGQFNPAGQNLA